MSKFSIVIIIAALTSASCQNPRFTLGNNLDNCSTWTFAVVDQARVVGFREAVQGAVPYTATTIPAALLVLDKTKALDAELSDNDIVATGIFSFAINYGLSLIFPVKKTEKELVSRRMKQRKACNISTE